MAQPACGRLNLAAVALTATMLWVILQGLVGPASAYGGHVYVKPGQSIQDAINKASTGDKIVVEAGTYAEQLTIDKDGVSLVGRGAMLVPPASPASNICSGLAGPGTQAGICVMGSGVVLAPFVSEHRKVMSVEKRVKDVSITGFQVSNFSGQNIALVGAQNARVTGNKLINGGQYGCLADGSKNTLIAENTVTAHAEPAIIGVCMDDIAVGHVSDNHISGYVIALCVQTSGEVVQRNDASGNCIGAFIDPFVKGAHILENHIGASAPACPPGSVFGIILAGADDTDVRRNIVEGQASGGPGIGLALFDDQSTGKLAVASGNVVVQNIFRNNDLDLFVNTTGTGNVIKHNICSTPNELCGQQ